MKLLTETDVARLTGLAPQTLKNQRHRGVGFPYMRLGGAIRYSEADVIAELERCRVHTTWGTRDDRR